jgi:hypothetical protein
VSAEDALADTRVTSRRDLAVKYAEDIKPTTRGRRRGAGPPLDAQAEPSLEKCPACGTWVKRRSETRMTDIKQMKENAVVALAQS